MSTVADLAEGGTSGWQGAAPVRRAARSLVRRKLSGLRDGRLVVREGETTTLFGTPAPDGLEARVTIVDPRFYSRLLFGGTVGAGESYMAGEWDSDDLTAVVRLIVRNRAAMEHLEGGAGRVSAPLRAAFHRLRKNTRSGSRRNIEAHYDLSNDFFRLVLDPTLTYSCAVFEHAEQSLEAAQIAKIDRLCRKLRLVARDHLLEIGTGWGALAVHAAQHYGCRVTTTTISPSQAAFARRRIDDAGLSERVTVLEVDYRDLEGTYDKLVSVEMIEAVGADHLGTFLRTCSDRLAPHGSMALQAITIDDRIYASALREVDFIQRYVFPGSFIPSVAAISGALAEDTDLRLIHLEDIGPCYAETLLRWRRRLDERADAVRSLGFSERFLRLWRFYFCYCEGGFRERVLGDAQLLLAKPKHRSAPILGEL